MIRIDTAKQTYHPQTEHTSYIMQVLPSGHLGHLHYGARLADDVDPLTLQVKHPLQIGGQVSYQATDPTFSLNLTQLEVATYGKGDFRDPSLHIELAEGHRITDFKFVSHAILDVKPTYPEMPQTFDAKQQVQTLRMILKDELQDITLHLEYAVFESADVITRRVIVINGAQQAIVLRKAMSFALDFAEADFELISLDGAWIRERHPHVHPLSYGILKIDSKKGVSSADHNPFLALKRRHTDEEEGECYGFSLLYSGNFEATAEVNPHRFLRIMMGINSFDFAWNLQPNGIFVTPEAVLTYSKHGLATLSHHFHTLVNLHIVPSQWQHRERPVLINNWEATYFDFDESKLLRLARKAKQVGIELFVLDDGWFGKRDNDTSSLGDWTVNTKKLPSGIAGLAQKINRIGLAFGIWVEPEMVNPDSDLYRLHPDWALRHPKIEPSLGRNQLVLDLCNPLVRDHLIETMSQLFQEANIQYVKWDMNRNLSDWYSPTLPTAQQSEIAHRYVLGLYEILRTLTTRFPDILFESCSSGGNRFDLGILYYMPQTWTSDNTDALERLFIQYGTSFVYPPSTMGAHVSNSPNAQVVRSTPIESRFNAAIFGLLGYELDLTRLSAFDLAVIKEQIAYYKTHRKLLQFGTFTRHKSPFTSNQCVWTASDSATNEALVGIYQVLSQPNGGFDRYRVNMLDSKIQYRLRNRVQYHNLSLFGDLVKHALPIKLKAHGLVFQALASHYKMTAEKDDFEIAGSVLSGSGFVPKAPFVGSGYTDQVRLMGTLDRAFITSNPLERTPTMRKLIPINFDWKYKPNFEEADLLTLDNPTIYESIAIPHTNKLLPYNQFDEADYQFVSVYKKQFTGPKLDPKERLFLHFGGVSVSAEVHLNGTLIGRHEGAFTPFEFDITSTVLQEVSNELTVVVDSRETKNVPPFGFVVDYLVYGGIYREVSLEIRPERRFAHTFIRTTDYGVTATDEMVLDISIVFSEPAENATLRMDLLKNGVSIQAFEKAEVQGKEVRFAAVAKGIERWTLDTPNLYDLTLTYVEANTTVDEVMERIGFRSFDFNEEGFVLNNEKIKLIGLNRHQSYPYVGYAMPKRLQEKDAEILKFELGCNIVRCSHYMQSDHFIRRCDEIGLLVLEEIPGWQYIGDAHFKELSKQNLAAMIAHHFNHPAIIMWGVRINESPDDHDFYIEMNELARRLDDSRPTGGIRNFGSSEFLEDVFTYNDFSHVGTNPGLEKPTRVTKKLMPYLVTESNGHMFPTKKFDNEARRAEHAKRHLEVVESAHRYDSMSGAISWCMADYNTHVEFGSGDRICYHGVLDMFRIPKYAAAVYASQQTKRPVLVVASNMVMGEYPASALPPTTVYTNCDYIKVYKNDEYIDTYYSAWDEYSNIPNAPVIIDDYIADRIHQGETYSKKVADMIKTVMLAYVKHGMRLTPKAKFNVVKLGLAHGVKVKDLMELFGKYIGDWGTKGSRYRFEGYKDDEKVIEVVRGSSNQAKFVALPDATLLVHGDTYDATRILVRMIDEFGNDLPYATASFNITVSEQFEIIGPNVQSLIGGSIGVYVKTSGVRGLGTIQLTPDHGDPVVVEIEVA
ncbi:MAG: alpha-galactosidase [Bacillus subtilis]|nr:alpha-galactosidase [Bacillus subtilis]